MESIANGKVEMLKILKSHGGGKYNSNEFLTFAYIMEL